MKIRDSQSQIICPSILSSIWEMKKNQCFYFIPDYNEQRKPYCLVIRPDKCFPFFKWVDHCYFELIGHCNVRKPGARRLDTEGSADQSSTGKEEQRAL